MPRWFTAFATLTAFLATILVPAGYAYAQQAVVVQPPPPAGQPAGQDPVLAQAQAHFQAGRDAFQANDFARAVQEFKAAQALRYSPKLDYNIGMAYERMNKPRAAAKYYRRYLEQMPGAPNTSEVQQKIAALESLPVPPQAGGEEGETVAPPPPTYAPQPGRRRSITTTRRVPMDRTTQVARRRPRPTCRVRPCGRRATGG